MALSFKNWIDHKFKNDGYKLVFNWQKVFEKSKEPIAAKQVTNEKIEITESKNHYYGLIFQFDLEFNELAKYYDEYYSITGFIDYSYFNSLKTEFIRHFPLNDRKRGVKYFDEMINELIFKYEKIQTERETEPPVTNEKEQKEKLKNDNLTVKTLTEFQTFIWSFIEIIHEFQEFGMKPKKIGQPIEIDFFELRNNIFNETYSIENLSPKFKNHKLRDFSSLNKVIYECAEYCRDISIDADDHDEIMEFGYLLLAVYTTVEECIELLNENSNEIEKSEQLKETEPPVAGENNSINDFPEIFVENGLQTFRMLDEKYKKDNRKLRAKYSNLFWFLKKEDLLRCSQLEYIDFIHEKYSVKMSKILPKTAKYEDEIQQLLMRYLKVQQ